MATRQYANNAASTLAAAVTNSQTGLTVSSGDGALFPTLSGGNWFVATLDDGAGTVEIVKATARTSDYFTVTRGQESTSPTAFPAGAAVELRPTAASFAMSSSLPTSFTAGDVLYATGTTTLSSLAIGAINRPLTSTGSAPQWDDKLEPSVGGTGLTSYTKGDIVYASSSTPTLAKLGIGSSGQVLSVSAGLPAWANSAVPTGERLGLVVAQTSAAKSTSVTITADAIDIEGHRNTAVNVAASLAVSGAGGLDTGAEGSSTTYYVWLIRKSSDGTVNGLLSTSATAPTMPSGYDQKRLVSFRRNDGSSNFIRAYQVNDLWLGDAAAMQLANAITVTTDLDTSSFIPAAIADMVLLYIRQTGNQWALDDKDDSTIQYWINVGGTGELPSVWVRKNAANLVTAREIVDGSNFTAYLAGCKIRVL